jgi:hypothetical protein
MNWGRQSTGSIRSSFICGKRKSGAPSSPAARRPGPPSVGLPVPQTEDQDVGEPDQRSGNDQLSAIGRPVMEQLMTKQRERGDVCRANYFPRINGLH